MALYTIITRYGGDEYVDQIKGSNERAALKAWAEGTDTKNIRGFGQSSKQTLIKEVLDRDNPCVKVDGAKNVWRMAALVRGKIVMITVIRTEGRRGS